MPAKLEAGVDKHDREIAAIRKLILQGMKMIHHTQVQLNELAAAQKRTEAAQQRTEKTLDRFIRSLERGGSNGHKESRL